MYISMYIYIHMISYLVMYITHTYIYIHIVMVCVCVYDGIWSIAVCPVAAKLFLEGTCHCESGDCTPGRVACSLETVLTLGTSDVCCVPSGKLTQLGKTVISIGKATINGPFWIIMLNYQRVFISMFSVLLQRLRLTTAMLARVFVRVPRCSQFVIRFDQHWPLSTNRRLL